MSGHSKWSTIKHKKALKDARRGRAFTKLIKDLTIAARIGGSDVNANPRLRTALAAARAASMPGDTIERAIKKGAGELAGVTYEEIVYEGHGPGGVAIMLQVLTDNKNRTVSEIRHFFTKCGGSLGSPNSVAWMFTKKGIITVQKRVVGLYFGVGINVVEPLGRGHDLWTANILCAVNYLPLKIGSIDDVKVDKPERPDARCGKVKSKRRTKPTGPDHKNAARF